MKSHRILDVLVVVFVALFLGRPLTAAELVEWGGSGGRWSDATNWLPNVVPNNDGTTYDVHIASGSERVDVDINVSVESLEVAPEAGDATVLVVGGATLSTREATVGTIRNGVVSVDGDGARWENLGRIRVGDGGLADLNVLNDGDVTTRDLVVASRLSGTDVRGVGTVNVIGRGSTIHVDGNLSVGNTGFGSLHLSDHGRINSPNDVHVHRRGNVVLESGGTIDAPRVSVAGRIEGRGHILGELRLGATSVLTLDVNDALRPRQNAISSYSTRILDGASLELEAHRSLPSAGQHRLVIFAGALGAFSVAPETATGTSNGHLGSGVFFEGINYQTAEFGGVEVFAGEVTIDVRQAKPGDANGDGSFNADDWIQVFQAGEFEDSLDGNSDWTEGDWNGDNDFTTDDLIVAFLAGGYDASGQQPIQRVPEPVSNIAILIGAFLLVTRCRGRHVPSL